MLPANGTLLRRVGWGVAVSALMVLPIVLVSLRSHSGSLRADIELTGPCEGTPIFLNYSYQGKMELPFECSFQCSVQQKYYLVYTNTDPQTGNYFGTSCGKDASVVAGSTCKDWGEDFGQTCDTGIAQEQPPLVDISMGPTVQRSSSSSVQCVGSECDEGGSAICLAAGGSCQTTGEFPCFACLNGSGSSLSSSQGICNGQACEDAGKYLCARMGKGCQLTNALPCFQCGGSASSLYHRPPTSSIPRVSSSSASAEFSSSSSSSAESSSSESSAAASSSEAPLPMPVETLPPPESSSSSEPMQIAIAYCGDGIVQQEAGEECDHGVRNGAPGDTCSTSCVTVAPVVLCGNGILDAGEACDDGVKNGTEGDGCSIECQLMPSVVPACGDGVLEAGEECDLGKGNGTPGSTCDIACQRVAPIVAVCGNGKLEQGEDCDNGASNGAPNDTCDTTCHRAEAVAGASLGWQYHGAGPASVVQLAITHAPQGQTGPETVIVMVSGAAAGFAWLRRKRKPNNAP